jgi:hypothetical protein
MTCWKGCGEISIKSTAQLRGYDRARLIAMIGAKFKHIIVPIAIDSLQP